MNPAGFCELAECPALGMITIFAPETQRQLPPDRVTRVRLRRVTVKGIRIAARSVQDRRGPGGAAKCRRSCVRWPDAPPAPARQQLEGPRLPVDPFVRSTFLQESRRPNSAGFLGEAGSRDGFNAVRRGRRPRSVRCRTDGARGGRYSRHAVQLCDTGLGALIVLRGILSDFAGSRRRDGGKSLQAARFPAHERFGEHLREGRAASGGFVHPWFNCGLGRSILARFPRYHRIRTCHGMLAQARWRNLPAPLRRLCCRGEGRRMGGVAKPLIRLQGVPLISRQLVALSGAGVDEVVVVTGYARRRTEEAVRSFAVTLAHNDALCRRAARLRPRRAGPADGSSTRHRRPGRPAADRRERSDRADRRVQEAPRPATSSCPVVDGRRGNPIVLDEVALAGFSPAARTSAAAT